MKFIELPVSKIEYHVFAFRVECKQMSKKMSKQKQNELAYHQTMLLNNCYFC